MQHLSHIYANRLELFMRLAGVKNFWGRDKGICRAWLGADPYIYLTEASKVEVRQFEVFFAYPSLKIIYQLIQYSTN